MTATEREDEPEPVAVDASRQPPSVEPGRNRDRELAAVLVGATTLALLWPALWNGYPLVFMDTGLYVDSAFTLRPYPARSPGYPMLLRPTLLGGSLWPVIVVQSLLTSALLVRVAFLLAPTRTARASQSCAHASSATTEQRERHY